MISFLTFLLAALLTAGSGMTAVCVLCGHRKPQLLSALLGLPIGSLFCALIVITLWICHVPFSGVSLLLPHAIIITMMTMLMRYQCQPVKDASPATRTKLPVHWSLVFVSYAIIGSTILASGVHAVLLPTFQYDSLTNWTMRSKISWADKKIAFDETEERGMAKPQYPILFHALQITANAGMQSWSDRSANTIHWLLSWSSLGAAWLLFARQRHAKAATLMIGLLCSIPLLSLHLWQGYADVTLLSALVLAALLMEEWHRTHARGMMTLSGIMVAAAVWTKSEGLIFGLLPWMLIALLPLVQERRAWRKILLSLAPGISLSLLWPLFARVNGLSLTPHTTDATFAPQWQAAIEMLRALFSRGSFGPAWYAAILITIWVFWQRMTAGWRTLLWGNLMAIGMIAVYLLTPNVRFLLNGESLYRQMLAPLALMIVGAVLAFTDNDCSSENGTLDPCTQPSSPTKDRTSAQMV